MNTFPTHDWQFWVVTALVAIAVLYIVWQIVPRAMGRKGKSRKATLTIGGKPVAPDSRTSKR
jgi:type VI protein secretion system component VasK